MLFNNITIDFKDGDRQQTHNKVILLHIPKTGGTSVEYILQNKWGSADGRHNNARQMQKLLEDLQGEEIDQYKIFTIVRNTFDRIISTWRWWAYHKDGLYSKPHLHEYNIPKTSFKEYVLMLKDYFERRTISSENTLSWKEGEGLVVKDPTEVIINSEKAPLTVSHIEILDWWLAKDDGSLIECDFLRFEDLDNEWEKYKTELNFTKSLPHKNASLQIPITKSRDELYDDTTYEIISEIYKDEIKKFNYE